MTRHAFPVSEVAFAYVVIFLGHAPMVLSLRRSPRILRSQGLCANIRSKVTTDHVEVGIQLDEREAEDWQDNHPGNFTSAGPQRTSSGWEQEMERCSAISRQNHFLRSRVAHVPVCVVQCPIHLLASALIESVCFSVIFFRRHALLTISHLRLCSSATCFAFAIWFRAAADV